MSTKPRLIAALLGATLLPNAFVMRFEPTWWFGNVPGLSASGPFNAHLVRDFGCPIFVAATGFLFAAWRPARAQGLVAAAARILVLHAAVHLVEATRHSHAPIPIDIATIYAPALFGLIATATWRSVLDPTRTRTG